MDVTFVLSACTFLSEDHNNTHRGRDHNIITSSSQQNQTLPTCSHELHICPATVQQHSPVIWTDTNTAAVITALKAAVYTAEKKQVWIIEGLKSLRWSTCQEEEDRETESVWQNERMNDDGGEIELICPIQPVDLENKEKQKQRDSNRV